MAKRISELKTDQVIYRYIEARRPIIYINHFDFQTIDRIIEKKCDEVFSIRGEKRYKIYEFIEASGEINFKTKRHEDYDSTDLVSFLNKFDNDLFKEKKQQIIVLLKDVHSTLMEDKRVLSALQSIAQRKNMSRGVPGDYYNVTVVIVDSKLVIPHEIEKIVTLVEISPPTEDEIKSIINDVVGNAKVDDINDIVLAVNGLSVYEIRQIIKYAIVEDNELNKNDLDLIFEEKRQAIQKSGLLELVNFNDKVDLGDFDGLIKYLEGKKSIFKNLADAKANGVDSPAGIMLVGMPGCGKSLSASCVAKMFDCPLLKLDIGRILGKYVGESEENLRKAIRVAEAASPCILWIDEIEKAFAGVSGGGSEVLTRMFGYFLTWLQEKTLPVYVLATANNISNLPPEFTRRGRFDEIFKVSLPEGDGIENIFKIHVSKRSKNKNPKPNIDYKKIVSLCKDKKYSGADIASIVKEAAEIAYLDDKRVIKQEDLEEIIKHTTSSNKAQENNATYKKMVEDLQKLDAKSVSK